LRGEAVVEELLAQARERLVALADRGAVALVREIELVEASLFVPQDSADMVLTFRNTHDWLNQGPQVLAKVFAAAYRVLKPGGVFGVVEHRARPYANAVESSRALHRIPEHYMIELGLRSGFRLAAVSEVNANPKDHEIVNAHRLPPDLAGPKGEHAKMRTIGESDRMTLRFVKPER
jgi:predicted methyltransferase